MISRLHLRNETHFVEWADCTTGRMQAKAFRQSHPEFRGRRIRTIIQAWPHKIECGTVYKLTIGHATPTT